MITQIPLDLIDYNPYQPRQERDDAHVIETAISIAADGLKQPPQARPVDGRYQLIFGHTRFESFCLLDLNAQTDKGWFTDHGLQIGDWSTMPLDVVEADNEGVFRGAVIENTHRKDLSAIDLAKSMLIAKRDFKYSSAQIGALYNMSESTVRGLLRFLELPVDVQGQLHRGEISQVTARKLLTVKRMATSEEEFIKIAESLKGNEDPDAALNAAVSRLPGVFVMWEAWRKDAPLAGDHLWPLGMSPEQFPPLKRISAKEATAALGLEIKQIKDVEVWIMKLSAGQTPDEIVMNGAPRDVLEKLIHLINPPGCTACPFYARQKDNYYCAFKGCHKRKAHAWGWAEMESISEKTGIAIFDPETDGKPIGLITYSYEPGYKKCKEMLEVKHPMLKQRHPDFRLQIAKSNWINDVTDSNLVRCVIVGESAEEIRQLEKKSKQAHQKRDEQETQKREFQQACQGASKRLVSAVMPPLLESSFQVGNIELMLLYLRRSESDFKWTKKTTDETKRTDIRTYMANTVLNGVIDWGDLAKGPVHMVGVLRKMFADFPIVFPENFDELAAQLMPPDPTQAPATPDEQAVEAKKDE